MRESESSFTSFLNRSTVFFVSWDKRSKPSNNSKKFEIFVQFCTIIGKAFIHEQDKGRMASINREYICRRSLTMSRVASVENVSSFGVLVEYGE